MSLHPHGNCFFIYKKYCTQLQSINKTYDIQSKPSGICWWRVDLNQDRTDFRRYINRVPRLRLYTVKTDPIVYTKVTPNSNPAILNNDGQIKPARVVKTVTVISVEPLDQRSSKSMLLSYFTSSEGNKSNN